MEGDETNRELMIEDRNYILNRIDKLRDIAQSLEDFNVFESGRVCYLISEALLKLDDALDQMKEEI
jgi:hypothetical protein